MGYSVDFHVLSRVADRWTCEIVRETKRFQRVYPSQYALTSKRYDPGCPLVERLLSFPFDLGGLQDLVYQILGWTMSGLRVLMVGFPLTNFVSTDGENH